MVMTTNTMARKMEMPEVNCSESYTGEGRREGGHGEGRGTRVGGLKNRRGDHGDLNSHPESSLPHPHLLALGALANVRQGDKGHSPMRERGTRGRSTMRNRGVKRHVPMCNRSVRGRLPMCERETRGATTAPTEASSTTGRVFHHVAPPAHSSSSPG